MFNDSYIVPTKYIRDKDFLLFDIPTRNLISKTNNHLKKLLVLILNHTSQKISLDANGLKDVVNDLVEHMQNNEDQSVLEP